MWAFRVRQSPAGAGSPCHGRATGGTGFPPVLAILGLAEPNYKYSLLCVLCASVATILLCLPTNAGSVRTADGKTYDGDVRLDKGQVAVYAKGSREPVRLNVDDVLSANFRLAEPPPKNQPSKPAAPQLQPLAAPWKTQDVGPTGTPGSVAVSEGHYAVKGAGANIKGAADSFFFVYQELRGDGQIVARLADLQLVNPDEKAGIMIRERYNERASRCAFLYFKPQDGSSFAWRSEEGGELTGTPPAADDRPPAWLKLTRQKGTITAYKSIDGEAWTQVGEPQDVAMDPQRVFVGLAVCSRDTNAACAATFEGVQVRPGRPSEEPPPKLKPSEGGLSNVPLLNRGVILRSGAVVPNVQIHSADDQSVKLIRDGKPMTLATSDVARLVLGPVSPLQLARIPPTGTGVLLSRGDFMEGEFASLNAGRLRLNSIVFGPADLASGSEALVVVLHDVTGSSGQAQWVVRTHDGLVYMAKSVRVDKDNLVIDDELAGTVRVQYGRLTELKAGAGRFDALADLRPDQVTVPPGSAAAAAYSTPATLSFDGQPTDRSLVIAGGASLTYRLDGRYKTFIARCGVVDHTVPMLAARVTVLADGKEVYRSPPLSSFGEPASIACPIEGAKQLTLKVSTAGDLDLPQSVVCADALLVK